MKKGYSVWRRFGAGLFLVGMLACSGPEGKSQELYELAQFEEEQNNLDHARQLYEEILEAYPETTSAEKARSRLEALDRE